MAEIGTVTAVFGAIKSAVSALKGLKELGLAAKHEEAVDAAMDLMRDAQDRVNSVHSELIELREENHNLRRKLDDDDKWEKERAQYNLVKTPGGAHVYQSGSEPNDLYVCPACVENRQIQYLQNMRAASGNWSCPSCNAKYPVNPHAPMPKVDYGNRWNP